MSERYAGKCCSLDESEQHIQSRFQAVNSGFHLPGLWGLHSVISGNMKPLDSTPSQRGGRRHLYIHHTSWALNFICKLNQNSLMLLYLYLVRCTWTWTWSVSENKVMYVWWDRQSIPHVFIIIIIIIFRNLCNRSGFGSNDTGLSRYSEEQQSSAFIKSYAPASKRLLEWNPSS